MGVLRPPRWLTELVGFARQVTRICAPPPRHTKLRGLWKLSAVQDSDVDTLRTLIHLGERLALLQSLPEWTAMLELKANLQAMAEETCRMRPGAQSEREDRLRVLAASEWWAVETLFAMMTRTITQSEQAKRRLRELVLPLP